MMEIWPAILVTGLSFAIPQYLVSNFIGPELVDIIAAIISMVCLIAVPARLAAEEDLDLAVAARQRHERRRGQAARAPLRHAQPRPN